jgi:two-component system LytT family response regulator
MQQIKAIVVDDEPDARRSLKKDIQHNFPEVEIVSLAENAEEALEAITKHEPDIVFLDVEMPGKNGLEVARSLKTKNVKTTIVFTTAFDQYAIEAIRYAAFDYLLKPVDMEELGTVLERYKTERNGHSLEHKLERLATWLSPDRIHFDTPNGFIYVRPVDIVYCQSDNKKGTTIALANGRTEKVNMKLKQIEALLPPNLFARISRSVLIGLNYLVKVDDQTKTVYLENMLVEYEFKTDSKYLKKLI